MTGTCPVVGGADKDALIVELQARIAELEALLTQRIDEVSEGWLEGRDEQVPRFFDPRVITVLGEAV